MLAPLKLSSQENFEQQNQNQTVGNAIIEITNLRLRTFIGFNPEEREKQQDIIINAEIRYPMPKACLDDEVGEALNYKTISKNIISHVENGRFLLLEKLVADLLHICSEASCVQYAKVKVDKPHALRFADSVSITLEYLQDSQTNAHTSSHSRGA